MTDDDQGYAMFVSALKEFEAAGGTVRVQADEDGFGGVRHKLILRDKTGKEQCMVVHKDATGEQLIWKEQADGTPVGERQTVSFKFSSDGTLDD